MSHGPRGKLAAIFRRQKPASPSLETPQPSAISDKPVESIVSDADPFDSPPPRVPSPAAHDPLLSLSPEETLEALRRADIVPSNVSDQHTDAIAKGIHNASATERALGVRAAVIGSKVRAWCIELGSWRWPGSFASPEAEAGRADEGVTTEGSLPLTLVEERRARIETIYDELEALDIEELKDFVRSAHLLPSSRGSSLYEMDITAPSVVRYLDDFTTLITGTILMALPYVHRLNRMLNIWSARLLVLGKVPSFLELLWSARTAVDSAWNAIKPDELAPNQRPELSREAYETMQAVLAARVTQLARTIDSMLDALEGHQDTLPDAWIDLMEAVQADYEEWVVIAERLVEEYTWRREVEPEEDVISTQPESQKSHQRDVSPAAPTKDIDSAKPSVPAELSITESYRALEASMAAAPPLLPPDVSLRDGSGEPPNETTPLPSNTSKFAAPAKAVHPATYMISRKDHAPDATTAEFDTPRKQLVSLTLSAKNRKSDEHSWESSPPQSATSSSFASDISEPQIMDASPVQLISYSPSRTTPHDDILLRRDSEQTDRSVSTVRGSVDHGDSKESSRTGSSLDQATPPAESSLQSKVRNIVIKRNDSEPSTPSPGESKIPEESEEAEDEPEEFDDDESYVEPTREPRTLEEQLSNRIRSIIANIPGRIRLASHAHGNDHVYAKQRVSSTQSRTASGNHIASRRTQRSVTPGLTLAPAFDKSTPKVHSGNSEIKVYHLQTPDREKPIKLYVRLVGDEERVMVRVGGGWADLGEYLRDYAIHHGRRTASGAATEPDVQPVGTPPRGGRGENDVRTSGVQSNGSSPASESIGLSDSPTGRPPPALANRKVRGPGSSALAIAPPQTPDSMLQRKTEALTPGISESQRTNSDAMTTATEEEENGDTSTDPTGGQTPRDDASVGLGGFKRNVELSPTRQAWVEGMLNQASRQASAEKEKERSKFGELGKAGATRRLFMRGKKDHD